MAGDWIKMRCNLWDDPRVARLCDATDQPEAMIVGGLYWLWAMADQHTEDGILPGLTIRAIDRKTGIQGLGEALCGVGWLADHPEGVRIVGFEDHNGSSAKKRCQTARRVASFKAGNAHETPQQQDGNAAGVTDALPERDLEKRREEKKEDISKATPSHPPAFADGQVDQPTAGTIPCPYQAIVDAYHLALPGLPTVKLMPVKRQAAMRKLWGWILSSKKADGTRRAQSRDEALAWVAGYFGHAANNDFLMGRSGRTTEHAGWQCDIDFLLSERGMKQVIEKTQVAA